MLLSSNFGQKRFFLLTCLRTLFIHCAATELMGIFSDIMNLKDWVGFSDSLVLPLQRLVVGVISAMVEKVVVGIGGKELWL